MDSPLKTLWLSHERARVEARVMDVSVGEGVVEVSVQASEDPALPIATEVGLEVEVESRGTPLFASARIRGWHVGRQVNTYVLVCPPEALAGLAALHRGRRNVRVAPDPNQPLPIALRRGSMEPVRARVVDVSRGGLGLQLDADDEPAILREEGPLQVRVVFEQGKPAVQLMGWLRRRWLEGTSVRLGLQFQHALLGQGAEAAGAAVHEYVHGRQVALLASLRAAMEQDAAA